METDVTLTLKMCDVIHEMHVNTRKMDVGTRMRSGDLHYGETGVEREMTLCLFTGALVAPVTSF